MDNIQPTTEEKILEAAKKVFHVRGYDGARMQEIANEAGVNKALVHYYYRNKDTLFKAVFDAAFDQLVTQVTTIFFSDMPLMEKIGGFTRYYASFLAQNSYVPIFILNALYKNPDQIRQRIHAHIDPVRMLDNIHLQMKNELGLDINPLHIFINILSLSIFPVVARPLLQGIFGFSDDQALEFYKERGTTVPEFVLNALKGYEKDAGK